MQVIVRIKDDVHISLFLAHRILDTLEKIYYVISR